MQYNSMLPSVFSCYKKIAQIITVIQNNCMIYIHKDII